MIEAIKIGKSFGERAIVRDFSARIMRGDRLGIVGPNGSGKTTLVKLLTGELEPDSGHRQARQQSADGDARPEARQPRSELDRSRKRSPAGGGDMVTIGDQSKHVVGYMRDFLFSPEQARTPVRVLSGGERGRQTLARALAKPSNVLVHDEPTNDLDLEDARRAGGDARRL